MYACAFFGSTSRNSDPVAAWTVCFEILLCVQLCSAATNTTRLSWVSQHTTAAAEASLPTNHSNFRSSLLSMRVITLFSLTVPQLLFRILINLCSMRTMHCRFRVRHALSKYNFQTLKIYWNYGRGPHAQTFTKPCSCVRLTRFVFNTSSPLCCRTASAGAPSPGGWSSTPQTPVSILRVMERYRTFYSLIVKINMDKRSKMSWDNIMIPRVVHRKLWVTYCWIN